MRVSVHPLVMAFCCMLACSPGRAFAQTVTDPQTVEFDPSPDHGAVDANGEPIVEYYELVVMAAGIPYQIVPLGKPTPQSDGKIRISLQAVLTIPPLPLVTHQAQVRVVGPTGSSSSNLSNPFIFSGPCTYAVAASSLAFTAAGGSGILDVTTGTGCVWSAGSAAAWVSLAALGGTGSGSVSFAVAPNTASSRSATINIAGKSLAVTQAGVAPPVMTALTTSPSPLTLGQPGTITIAGSNFSASTVQLLLNGPGCTPCTIPNSLLTTKTATQLVAPVNPTAAGTYTVSAQNGVGGPVSNNLSFTIGSIPVITTLTTSPSPLRANRPGTLTTAGSGFNTSTVQLLINGPECSPCTVPNNMLTTKTATWLVAPANPMKAGIYTVVVQNGAGAPVSNAASLTVADDACIISISPASQTFPFSGGSGSVNVTAPEGCAWTPHSSAAWLTPGSGGNGNGSVGFTVAANPTTALRSASITIGNRSITVTEEGSRRPALY